MPLSPGWLEKKKKAGPSLPFSLFREGARGEGILVTTITTVPSRSYNLSVIYCSSKAPHTAYAVRIIQ